MACLAVAFFSALILGQDPAKPASAPTAPTAESVFAELQRLDQAVQRLSPDNPQRARLASEPIETKVRNALEKHAQLFAEGDGRYWRGRMHLLAGADAEGAKVLVAYAGDANADPKLASIARVLAARVVSSKDREAALALLGKVDRKVLDVATLTHMTTTLKLLESTAAAVEDGGALPEIPVEKVLNGPADLTFDQLKNNVLVIDFWATWCGPCRATIPELVKLQDKYKHLGVQVVGVTTLYGTGMDFADKAAVPNGGRSVRPESADAEYELNDRFVKAFEINYPIVFTGKTVGTTSFNVRGIPTAFVVGRDGTILGRVVGAGQASMDRLEALVRQALEAKKPQKK